MSSAKRAAVIRQRLREQRRRRRSPRAPLQRRRRPTASNATVSRWKGRPAARPRAKVNIVAFSDFQCPFCSRVTPTLDRIMKDYNGQVRMFFRHNPLPFHSDAPAGRRGRAGRGCPGQVLGDARQAVRQPAEHQAARPGEVRAGTGPRHGQVQGLPGRQQRQVSASTPTWRWARRSACRGPRTSSSTAGPSAAPCPSRSSRRSSTRRSRPPTR